MNQGSNRINTDIWESIKTLHEFSWAQKRVSEIIALTHDIDVSEKEVQRVHRKLQSLIWMIQKCISHPQNMLDISTLITGTMADIDSREIVRNSYSINPLDLTKFVQLSLASQLIFLFAQKRSENMPGVVCHHWTIFWYNFWKLCKAWTLFADTSLRLCQRTNNHTQIGYDYHSFVLIDLEKRYIINASINKGVSMRPASNFSELERKIYRTDISGGEVWLEKIRTYKTTDQFAKTMDRVPWKEAHLAFMLLRWLDQKV